MMARLQATTNAQVDDDGDSDVGFPPARQRKPAKLITNQQVASLDVPPPPPPP